ncbi:hypothetical protein EON83_25820 [bacterium]|nr:MAG: hypothetical protein EON83_25820 [bacterium]
MPRINIHPPSVYLIRHKCSGRVYVGSSVHIAQRWAQHRRHLRLGQHHSPFLQRAWDKYGPDAFEWQIIENASSAEELVSLEQKWIDFYQSATQEKGFNVGAAVGRPRLGKKHTAQTLAKISEKTKGLKNPHTNKLAFEDIPTIFQRLTDGETVQAVADSFNVKRRSICDVAFRRAYAWIFIPCELEQSAKEAVLAQQFPRMLPPETRDAIAKYYCDGHSSLAISRQFGIGTRTVFSILEEKGIPSRPSGGHNRIQQSQRDAITKSYCDGNSSLVIAKQFGISSHAVSNILKEKGIPSRPSGGHNRIQQREAA